MSWIFGIIHKKKNGVPLKSIIAEEGIFEYTGGPLEIYAGGNQETLVYSREPDESFIASGCALDAAYSRIKVLDKAAWKNALQTEGLTKVDGRFAAVSWNGGKLRLHTDVLGLRDFYIKESSDWIIISTRIDLIAKVESLSVNFSEFGGRWLLINQVSHNSVFNEVKRIVCGTKAEIDLSSFRIEYSYYNWLPLMGSEEFGFEEFRSELRDSLSTDDGPPLSLSLSGGMDSRVLLSFLINRREGVWDTHTFGDPRHPDAVIASRLSRDVEFPHVQIDMKISGDMLIQGISAYSCGTAVNNASSGFLQLYNYEHLKNSGKIYIDGGFGEIWRREFLNRLLWKGKTAVYEKDARKIFQFLRLERADIFIPEAVNEMREGCIYQIEEALSNMPSQQSIGIENWLDLFALKTRLPNYYGPEQSRLDGIINCIMPFCRKTLLDKLFAVPAKLRKNGVLLKKIISSEYPALKKYPLAKGGGYSPFRLNSLEARILSKIKHKAGIGIYRDARVDRHLNSIRDAVSDIANSKSVKEFPAYDYGKIKTIVEEYYKGNPAYSAALDWFISFELFRKNIYESRKP